MRILMIIDGLSGGGAEKVLLTLAQGLLNQNHRVSIFSLRNVCDYKVPKELEYTIIAEHSLTPWRKLTELTRVSKALDKEIQISQKRDGEYDLIFSHLHKTDRIVARSRILPKERIWFCLHSMFSVAYLAKRQGFSRWLKRKKIQKLYQNRNLIAVSHGVLEDLKQVFHVKPRKAKVIHNPFDFLAIRKLAQAPCDLAGQNYLIHVARLHQNKRQDRLLKAYAKSGIQAPLVILGKGSNTILQQLQAMAQDLRITNKVHFRKFDSNPYPYIQHARMLILSSDSEGFGNVLVEALICQTPVISTRCPGGVVEILSNELSAGLADLNSTSLAKIMRAVYANPPTVSTSHFITYDIAYICKKYLDLARNCTPS